MSKGEDGRAPLPHTRSFGGGYGGSEVCLFCARLRVQLRIWQALVAATAARGTLALCVGRIASRAILSRRRRVALMGAACVRSQSVLELDTSWTPARHALYFRQ